MTESHDVFDCRADEAIKAFYAAHGSTRYYSDLPGDRIADVPFSEWMSNSQAPDDAQTVEERMQGVMQFFQYLASRSIHPASMLKWIFAIGRALHISPFCDLTMTEAAIIMGETKAAHSHRCKILSGEIRIAGFRGTRIPRQKTEGSTAAFSAAQKGNTNRRSNAHT